MIEILINILMYPIHNPVEGFLILLVEYALLMALWAFVHETRLEKILAPFVWFFLLQDWIYDWILVVLFLDPKAHISEVVTGRMKRYKAKYIHLPSWERSNMDNFKLLSAKLLCRYLNLFDYRGTHC